MAVIPGVLKREGAARAEPQSVSSPLAQRLLLILPGAAWLFIFGILPLSLIAIYSFAQRGTYGGLVFDWTLENYTRLAQPIYLEVFWRSFVLALNTTLLCLLGGYPLAYAIATANPVLKNRLLLLIIIPFWTNFLIRTYAWIMILRSEGLLNSVLTAAGIIRAPLGMLYTPGAVLIGFVYNWLPFMVLPLYASLEKMDRDCIEAAMDLGARGFQVFARVILPLSLPGVLAGSILVFIPALAMFAIPDLLGGARSMYIGNLIKNQFLVARNWPFGAALSVCLIVAMVVAMFAYAWALRRGEARS